MPYGRTCPVLFCLTHLRNTEPDHGLVISLSFLCLFYFSYKSSSRTPFLSVQGAPENNNPALSMGGLYTFEYREFLAVKCHENA